MSAVLERAAEAARGGQYEEAVASLEGLGGRESDDPRVLDLLARVYAQRGEFADADSCWVSALSLDPDWRGAVEGRRRIVALQAKRFRMRLWPGVVALVAVAGVLLPSTPPPPSAPDLSGIVERQDQLARELAALRVEIVEPSSPRFTASRLGDSVLVTFNEPLFGRDARLSAEGRAALADLRSQVKAPITVIGHGRTADLGLRRAQAAAAELPGPVNLRSAGNTQPPYPAGDRRNNTVTVLIGQ